MKPVGRISRVFGDSGELLISLYDTFTGEIEIGEPLFVKIDKLAVPLFVKEFRRSGKGGEILFSDIDSISRAESLLGLVLYIKRDREREPLDESEMIMQQFEGLIGYGVALSEEGSESSEGESSSTEGEIVDFVYSDLNPILILEADGAEVLIPINSITINSVDEEQESLHITLPAGLLDIYLGEETDDREE